MSHVSKIRTAMTEKVDLKDALGDMGYVVKENLLMSVQDSDNRWREVRGDLVVEINQGLHIIFTKENNKFSIVTVFEDIKLFDRKFSKAGFLGELAQKYACRVAKRELASQGFEMLGEENEGGVIRLVLGRTVLKEGKSFGFEHQEVESRIDAKGDVSLTVRGVKGGGCLDITKDIERSLGGDVVEREMTLEAYGDPEKGQAEKIPVPVSSRLEVK